MVDVDISQLAIDRQERVQQISIRRNLVTRYAIPFAILFGFLGLLVWTAWDYLVPPRDVKVVPVIATESEARMEGTPLFNAAGWIEPRPTAIRVAALAPGVVEQLLVVEDQQVKKGEPVAELIKEDAQLAYDRAIADRELAEAELKKANAALAAAITNYFQPVYLEAGMTENVMVPVKGSEPLTDGETLWVMLHEDNGTTKTYEFDGQNGFDGPYYTEAGDIAITPISISSPAIEVSDQKIVDNKITIGKVTAAQDGWLVIHNDDGSGNIVLPGIIGKVQVSEGVTENIEVTLDESVSYTVGQKLFPMLHIDTGEIGEYEFDGNNGLDSPEVFGNAAFPGNVIFTSLTVE